MIRTRAFIVGAVPLAFLLLLLALAFLLQQRMLASAAWSERAEQAITQAQDVVQTLGEANAAVVSYATKGRAANLTPFSAARTRLPEQLAQLRHIVRENPAQSGRAATLSRTVMNAYAVIGRYLRYLQAGQTAAAKAYGSSKSTRAAGLHLQDAYEKFNNAQRSAIIAHSNSVRGGFQNFGLTLVLCSLGSIIVTLLVSGQFGFGIARRLDRLAENARRLAAGEKTEPIEGNDEITALDRVYHEMTQRIQAEHKIASQLQRVLLPRRLPDIPGLRIDTAYTPAAQGTEIGGDWYDVFPISERRIAIGVGDVAGHGLRSASIMGAARLAVRAAARIDSDPGAVLAHVNRVLCADEPDVIVTAFLALLDLDDGTLAYAVAGHPQPIVARSSGTLERLEGGGFVLGVDPRVTYATYHTQLDVGSAIVLYTDGIVEAERDYFKGMESLEAAVRAEYANAGSNIAEAIRSRVFAQTKPTDDSALLFIGVTALGISSEARSRSWSLDARAEAAARRVKRALLWHLSDAAPSSDLPAVELIFGELLGNVARHTPGPAEITLEYANGEVLLHVADRGEPFSANGDAKIPAPLSESGRGLFLVRAMARDVRIQHTGSGNRVSAVLPIGVLQEGRRAETVK